MTPDHRIEKEIKPTPMQLYIDKGTDEVDYRGSPRGVRFPDQKESYGIEIRRGVAEFHQKFPEKMDATVSLNKMCLNDIMLGVTTTEETIYPGKMKIDGLADHVVRFFLIRGIKTQFIKPRNEAPRSPALAGRGIKRNYGVANPLLKIEPRKVAG